ncbi:MAG: hypothetical protein K1X50_11220, partial [Candidatus Promineofilum sp.]|nr:hypothetical protein [Promineifilum sp.]
MSYNLASLDLPTLRGRTLRLFAAAIDSRPLSGALTGQLLKQGGIVDLRAKTFSDAPTFYPLALAEAEAQRDAPPLDWQALQDRLLRRDNREPFPSAADYARKARPSGRLLSSIPDLRPLPDRRRCNTVTAAADAPG